MFWKKEKKAGKSSGYTGSAAPLRPGNRVILRQPPHSEPLPPGERELANGRPHLLYPGEGGLRRGGELLGNRASSRGKGLSKCLKYGGLLLFILFISGFPAMTLAGYFPAPSPTDRSAVFLGSISISGLPAQPGDEVAFFDPQGVLSGLYVVDTAGAYGMMAVYGDDPSTTVADEGAEAGDVLTIKVWDSRAGTVLEGDNLILSGGTSPSEFFQPSSMPPVWKENSGFILNIDTSTHFPRPGANPWVSQYIVNLTINGVPASFGDEIAVFDPDGILAGLYIVGQDGPLDVYGDDANTASVDEGAEEGDVLTFKVWVKSAGIEYGANKLILSPGEPMGEFYISSLIPPVWTKDTGCVLNIEVTEDATPPETLITANPGSLTNSGAATFEFTSSEPGSTFECQLDNSGYAPCTSPVYYPAMLEGAHTFSVRATDMAGNTDPTPAGYTWTIDTQAPDTSITQSPASLTNSVSASFSFGATEEGATFQCQLDGGSYGDCVSPKDYPGLAEGSHTFSVKATDPAGNTDATAASFTWVIDLSFPQSSIISPGSGATIVGPGLLVSGQASDTGSQVQRVEVSTDGGATWYSAAGTTDWSYDWTFAGDGTFTIKSRAIDEAGNIELPGPGVTVAVYKREPSIVKVSGRRLLLNGEPFVVKSVGYSPVPVGDDLEINPPYGDYFTAGYSSIYNRDLPQLREMRANAVRLWNWTATADHRDFLDKAFNQGINPIYVIAGFWINPGLDIDPVSPNNVREQLKDEFKAMVAAHKNYPALLMWVIGNELNADWMYGGNLGHLFSLLNEMAEAAHAEEGAAYHPVTTALMDRNLITTIAAYNSAVPALDLWGANVYRGNTFGSLFTDYQAASDKPLIILEYGIDAYDKVHGTEYEYFGRPYQAEYAEALWKEIAANSDVAIGGSIMAYSDEWWKGKHSTDPGCPETLPSFHGTCGYASSSHPDGYANEEWWGLMRIKDNGTEPDIVKRRAVFYSLQALWAGVVRGDIDNDGMVDLKDALLALQLLAGMNPPGIRSDYAASMADVNGDNRIGLAEVVYILQKLAAIR